MRAADVGVRPGQGVNVASDDVAVAAGKGGVSVGKIRVTALVGTLAMGSVAVAEGGCAVAVLGAMVVVGCGAGGVGDGGAGRAQAAVGRAINRRKIS